MEKNARRIVDTLRTAGHEAYFAGGCVRDLLLGSSPQDYDIATSARPEQVEGLFRRTVAVGAQFGVIVVVEDGHEFEVATFRADGDYLDGRRPESVTFSTAEGDALRRDFTINGLFFDPTEERVLDFVGGRSDLDAGLIRAIGDPAQRFEEDKLRVLRGVRFAARFNFKIAPATWEAICAGASRIHVVSAERIRDELVKILTHPSRLRGFDLLDQSGLLRELLPEVETLKGCEQPPEFHPEGDVFVHTRIMLEMLPPNASLPLVLGVLFHDLGKPPTFQRDETGRIRFNGHEYVSADITQKIMTRLRFSNAEIAATDALVRNHMAFKDVQDMRVAKLKRFLARETIDDELELHRVDCGSSHGMLDNYDFLLAKREEFASEPLIPPPLLTGHDLIALGWKPGPQFKQTLDTVQTLQLEGALRSRDEALAWLAAQPS
ncbi:MAG TPA: CCA tRNA nucleotidyltransferase [Chthoniobacterales bacterium]|nr:CCA tRNA nucleotidyltransferase [Chthoniobacterales bacterium]